MPDPYEVKLKKHLRNVVNMKTSSCLETGIIGLYIEGKLPKGEKIKVEKHITSCLYCLDQLTELRELVYFQKHRAPIPSHLLQKIKSLYPKEKSAIRGFLKDIFYPSLQGIYDYIIFPLRQWRYATVSIATAIVVILTLTIYKGLTPEKPLDIKKIPEGKAFTMLKLTEAKNPIIIETGDIDNTFEKVRRIIQAHNGKLSQALWVEKGIKITFSLKKEEEISLFNDFNKLGRIKIEKEGYRDKDRNIVVLLKER